MGFFNGDEKSVEVGRGRYVPWDFFWDQSGWGAGENMYMLPKKLM